MPRSYHEPLEFEDLFDQEEAQRRRDERDAMIAKNEELRVAEEKRDTVRRENARNLSVESAGRLRLKEYHDAGVEPLALDEDGFPTNSLSLLRNIGWRIEEVEHGRRVLVRPAYLFQQGEATGNDEPTFGS